MTAFRSRRRGLGALALASALVLFAGACGDDDDDATTDETTDTTADTTDETTDETTETTEGTSAEPGASVDGTLVLGSLMPLTGDLQDYGPGMAAAVELAVADINEAGGVLDQDVVLVTEDSGSDATVAGPAADKLVTTDNVDAVMGSAGSTETLQGTLPNTVSAGRIACSGSATSPELTAFEDEGLFFRTAPSDAFQSQLIADQIAGAGYSSVAIVNRADDYGQAFADAATGYLEDAGAEVVASVAVDPEPGADYDADVQQVVDAAPDAIVLILFPEEGATILNLMIEAGAGPADVPIYVTDGMASDDLGASVDEANAAVVDGIVGTRPGSTDPTDFNERLTAGGEVSEVTFAAQFYDCTVSTALAAVAAGTDDPEAIAAELPGVTRDGTKCADFAECTALLADGEDIDYDGVTGFDFNDDGEPAAATYELWEFVDGAISGIEVVTISAEGGDEAPDSTTTTAAE